MGFRMTRTHLGATLAMCAAATLAMSASPASAKISDGYVRGYDTYVGDWGDEGTISTAAHSQNNAVCLWQTILWAEGANESDGTNFDGTDIDGIFGGNTYGATKRLQVSWGLASSYDKADGMVGPNTFGRADNQLVKTGGSTARGRRSSSCTTARSTTSRSSVTVRAGTGSGKATTPGAWPPTATAAAADKAPAHADPAVLSLVGTRQRAVPGAPGAGHGPLCRVPDGPVSRSR